MPSAMAQSPAALQGWMALLEALAKGLLSKKLAAELALALAGINHCQYCASSHTALSKLARLGIGFFMLPMKTLNFAIEVNRVSVATGKHRKEDTHPGGIKSWLSLSLK